MTSSDQTSGLPLSIRVEDMAMDILVNLPAPDTEVSLPDCHVRRPGGWTWIQLRLHWIQIEVGNRGCDHEKWMSREYNWVDPSATEPKEVTQWGLNEWSNLRCVADNWHVSCPDCDDMAGSGYGEIIDDVDGTGMVTIKDDRPAFSGGGGLRTVKLQPWPLGRLHSWLRGC